MRKLSWKTGGSVACRGEPLKQFAALLWRTLHKAAEVRRDATYYFLNEEHTLTLDDGSFSEPRGLYRKSCYASYTSKRGLDLVRSRLDHRRADLNKKGPHFPAFNTNNRECPGTPFAQKPPMH